MNLHDISKNRAYLLSKFSVNSMSFGSITMKASAPKKILVLGGTGFVGSNVIRYALSEGFSVTSLSRRGKPSVTGGLSSKVDWKKGDATNPDLVSEIIQEGEFDAVIHTIGMLFEGEANKYASGSGSIPDKEATYDKITRQTAFAAMAAFSVATKVRAPFLFVSAAEAKWGFDQLFEGTPAEFLRRYLIAKRAVEDELLKNYGAGDNATLRPVIFRPSLVWTPQRPQAIPPVLAFTIANAIGLPQVDKPVTVETLAKAIIKSVKDETITGIQDFRAMEKLASKL
mmetsp:Transcript_6838/g.9016  ORF Transcript_6838/g.9016 Transcript_6838/m.9016 type:complete len:284 (-) Transcript_6838:212-1063(-)